MSEMEGAEKNKEGGGKKGTDPKEGATKKKARKPPENEGKRMNPNPCDGNGCDHVGVLELKELPRIKELPRTYLKSYVKEGGCFFHMPCCYDCKKKEGREDVEGEGTVMLLDLADLLTHKKGNNDEMAQYCNYRGASHNMQEDDEWKT
jgi:hypothetical protein